MSGTKPAHGIAPNAPYYDFARWLHDVVVAYNQKRNAWRSTTTDIAALMGCSNSTAGYWLSGQKRPQRAQCVSIANAFDLDLADVLHHAGYRELSDNTSATLPELVAYVMSLPKLDSAQRDALVVALKRAQSLDGHWSDIVSDVLRKNWPLLTRASYIAQIVSAQPQTRAS